MRKDFITAQEAYDSIMTNFGKQDLITIYLSESEHEGESYNKLANLLDTTKITSGYYVCESDEDANEQQRVYVQILPADIILKISMTEGGTFDFDQIWDIRKVTSNALIDWGDGIINSEKSHVYSSAFDGTIKIYGCGMLMPKNAGKNNTTKSSIIEIELVTPQIVESASLFNYCNNLTTVKGDLYFTETYTPLATFPLFTNCSSLTTLKNFIIHAPSTKKNNFFIEYLPKLFISN